MAFNAPAAITALKTLCQGLTSVQQVRLAPPKSLFAKKTVFIWFGSWVSPDVMSGVKQRELSLWLCFATVLDGDEEAAELELGAFIDEFTTAFLADRTLGGAVGSADTDGAPADDPQYQLFAGEEARLHPIRISTKQRQAYDNT